MKRRRRYNLTAQADYRLKPISRAGRGSGSGADRLVRFILRVLIFRHPTLTRWFFRFMTRDLPPDVWRAYASRVRSGRGRDKP